MTCCVLLEKLCFTRILLSLLFLSSRTALLRTLRESSLESLAEEEIKTESDAVEGMEAPKVPDLGSAEAALAAQKRKAPSPPHSSNGHSPSDTSPSAAKKKKKPGLVGGNNKDQDGRNDFYCWVCHREGQVLCCELCPRVYHAKCLKLAAEPEGDWFCPECEKITVAECIETQSKAMTMLNLEQLSYLLKFALQKMKQPGTEPFHKPVSLEQHPDYAEYIFHPMDVCTLEKNIKKKMYGCTEAFLADVKWILHNCIIYNGGNHKLTATAKVIVKICEHEMNEIEVCPECYLSACQKRDNWFCEPCSQPHPLVWAKLKGFPFWPAKALRDKDGQVDARFFGQHDRAWVPINNCYLMSKEIPFSVKKTKSIFNSAMQEMEVYVENVRKKYGVFNYAPFRTPYTPNNQFQMLQDPSNPKKGTVMGEKQDKVKFNFDMTASPKMLMSKSMMPAGAGRRISMTDMPRSPMSTNSSVHTGSDLEQDASERGTKLQSSHCSAGEDSMDCTASPASQKTTGSPKPVLPAPLKQERTQTTGSILNLNLDRIKAEMDLKELSESVQQQQQQQGASVVLTSPKKPTRSLDKTIESCKAQLGIQEISDDVYRGVDHSDSDDSDKSDSSDSEYASEEEHGPKESNQDNGAHKDSKKRPRTPTSQPQDNKAAHPPPPAEKATPEPPAKKKASAVVEKELKEPQEKPKTTQQQPAQKEKPSAGQSGKTARERDPDSDSERELVIDLGDEHGGRERKRPKRETPSAPSLATKDTAAVKPEGKTQTAAPSSGSPSTATSASPSTPSTKDSAQPAAKPPSISTQQPTSTSSNTTPSASQPGVPAVPSAANSSSTAVKKQRPLLPKEAAQAGQSAVVWNQAGNKLQTSSQKWHMQKVQRQQQQQQQQQGAQPASQPAPQAQPPSPAATSSASASASASASTRYQTRQSVKGNAAVQQKDSSSNSALSGDFLPSADVAADIAKYTSKMMDAIKGTMTEIYNDLSKSTTGNTIAEIRRLRIEIEKLQWLHQQELSEMKHNLELTMAEMRQSLEQERERLVSEVKKQMELEKQQAVDETKKKQWCANCKKEAIFYCCWNTSYCDYPCQQAHWPEHMKSCTQSATASQQEEEDSSTAPAAKPSGQSPKAQISPPANKPSPPQKSSPPTAENTRGSTAAAVS
ncbi:protein kinase C binding protein 1, like isoform X3 [Astyanax mexicanus]|uniref:protein kinase C binding protein 1, like isoform X3 n=1 Tax=Astyanax mexicanus TaxID=7994 RepID=UPI0020CB6126|nr:protein kinase C binding protein 1, like isoform X3 [Astyanax mexicanus]